MGAGHPQGVDESTLEQVHLKASVAMVPRGARGGSLKGLWLKAMSMLEKVHLWLRVSPSGAGAREGDWKCI